MIDKCKTSLNGKRTTLRLVLRVAALFLLFLLLVVGAIAEGQEGSKMSGALQTILARRASGFASAQDYAQTQGVEIKGPDERIVVVIEGSGDLSNQIRSLRGTLQAKYQRFWQVELPLASVRALAQAAKVSYIRLPLVASSFPSSPLACSTSNPQTPSSIATQGTIISEGVALIGADQLHEKGITGRGVKVGIIDLGFAGLDKIIERGELPENIVPWNGLGTNLPPGESPSCKQVTAKELSEASGGEVHGTAVAEIIHDVAPDAELHLFLVSTGVELGRALTKAIEDEIKVINHSVGWYNSNFYDGTGLIGNIVRTAHQNKIFWVNAAGNDALTHYECTFQDADRDSYHDEDIQLTLEAGGILKASLTWDAWPSTDEDFDLFLYSIQKEGLRQETASLNRQNGTEPEERITFIVEEGTYKLRIQWVGDGSPPKDRRMELFLSPSWMKVNPNVPRSSLPTPANSKAAFVVGAVGAGNWEAGELEPFSSQGPTNGGLHKPELVAPDYVSTASYGTASSASVSGVDERFGGTSAAAPHVAGAAALLLSEDPARTLADLERILKERAKPIAKPVNQVGAGGLGLTPPQLMPDLLITSAEADPKEAEPGGTVHIRARVKNIGRADVERSFWVVLRKKVDEDQDLASDLVEGLEAGEEKEVSLQWDVPNNQASGEEQLVVMANPYGDVKEKDEMNNRQELTITILVRPRLEVEPQELKFQAQEGETGPSSQTLTIRNSGGGTLNWVATVDAGWIQLGASQGSLGAEQSDQPGVSVDISELKAGDYQATITITAEDAHNSPAQVSVTLTVIPPRAVLEVSPEQVNFEAEEGGDDPDFQSLTIQNDGGQPLNWQATTDEEASWLKLSPPSGAVDPRQSTTVQVSVDISRLKAGDYQASITITAKDAKNSPAQVSVTLTVDPPPAVLEVSPEQVNFEAEEGGDDPDSQSLTIKNAGGQPLNWKAETDEETSWLKLSPISGTVDPGQSMKVDVSAGISGLSAGTYPGTITFSAPGAQGEDVDVSVTLTIAPRRDVPLTITSIDFPAKIQCESTAQGTVKFADDGDINRATFEVVEAMDFEPFEFNPREAPSFSFDTSTDTGSFKFNISCNLEQEVKLRVILFDKAGNKSDPWEFSFECSLGEGG